MRKIYSILMIALFLLPLTMVGANQAISKAARTDGTNKNDSRAYVQPDIIRAPDGQPAPSFSVAAWVKIGKYSNIQNSVNQMVVFGYGGREHCNTNGSWNFCIDSNGRPIITGWGGFDGVLSETPVSVNEWHYFTAVYDAATKSLSTYIDGVLLSNKVCTKASVDWFTNETPAIYFGGYCFNGLIDEAHIWNKALTAQEVEAAKSSALGVDGLVGLYTFDEAPASTGTFANQSTQACASAEPCYFENVTGTEAWTNGPVYIISAGSYSLANPTLVESDRVVAVEEYTVNIAANPAVGGNVEFTNPASSESTLATTNPIVTVKATANLGWAFRNWTDGDDNVVSTDPTYTYTGAADVTLTANFVQVKTYTVNITQPENGTITVTADGNDVTSGTTLNQNTVLTISATPASGYQLANYLVNGVATSNPQVVVTSNLTISASFEVAAAGPSYCAPSGTTSRSDSRGISKLDVSDDNGNSIEVTGPGVGTAQALYVDQTGTILTTTAGATITVKNNGTGTWMHSYIYIDINQNGVFDVNEANCQGANVDGELFAHTGYTGVDGGDPSVFSDGTSINYETSYNLTMPSFTLPADLAPGTYRIRHKIDWNCVDPCGRLAANGYSGNLMNNNGGGIIDFTIKIVEPQYTLTYSATGNGDIEARVGVSEATNPTASGFAIVSGSAIENDVYVILTPKQYNGQINTIASATLNGENVKDMLYTYTANNANEATYYYICIPKADVTEDQVFTAVFEGEVQGIDGIGIDPANGPVEYYNLQGVRVAAENLVPGFYVLRQGSKAVKVFIRK